MAEHRQKRPAKREEEPGPRRLGREAAVQILYGLDAANTFDETTTTAAIERYWSYLEGPALGRPFADELVRAVIAQREQLDQAIRTANPNWRLERMARVDRNILRLATMELLHRNDVPPQVAIDEAIELAKRFGTEESPAFVNGTLDKVARSNGKL